MNKKHIKASDAVFVVILSVALLLLPITYIVLPQREISENQQLELFPAFSVKSFADTVFQSKMELALKDQFVLHDTAMEFTLGSKGRMHALFNNTQSLFTHETGLVPYGNVFRMYGTNYLTNMPYLYNEQDTAAYRRKADEINSFAEAYPNSNVFVYYCTRSEDLSWFNKTEGFENFSYINYLEELLNDDVYFAASRIQDFEDYCQKRYKTDHHWTNTGANWGYIEILSLMQTRMTLGQPRSIAYTMDFNSLEWAGSRYRESAMPIKNIVPDDFKVDTYVLPQHKSFFGDDEMPLGLIEDYANGEVNRELGFDQYLNYYGFESQPIRLEYENGNENLLIVGDSFARAIREPLASHFNTTVFVNFRLLDTIDLHELMDEYHFDAVLFIGQQDAFSGYFISGE